ncbi:1-acylglycerol-3-phosphate O-acyltransferase ABHD5-like [Dendronephthya gigantea]|uniref:1-acylglycerol-3-phosphate O-acyltransferase ABHD5-like n=1 Tax=Dendronephthya gigantea TaxID=151771 RepID=UPI00106D4D1B|nr:1-acylglycerol-3-phosphate O-acyltransferase ABHD5-like [Dendronephthya gigantea]
MLFGIDKMIRFILIFIINCLLKLLFKFETVEAKLERTELLLLKSCRRFYQEKFITVEDNVLIRTVVFNPGVPNKPALVLLHGLNTGLCSFLYNAKRLSRNCTVYAIDLPGFARSSKPSVSGTVDEIERKYVRWLELWRQNLAIEKCFLLGHDFGGYIATLYTLMYPWRVCHLTLYEPWGFPILPFGMTDRSPNRKSIEQSEFFPRWLTKLDVVFHCAQRLKFIYAIACFYCRQLKYLYQMIRHPCTFVQNLFKKQEAWSQYKKLCQEVQNSSGKNAYSKLSVLNIWARDPLIKRINSLDEKVQITFIFGSKSWFDHRSAYEVKCSRLNQNSVNVNIIEGQCKRPIHEECRRDFENIILQTLSSYEDEQDEGWIEDEWISYDHSDDETNNVI